MSTAATQSAEAFLVTAPTLTKPISAFQATALFLVTSGIKTEPLANTAKR